MVTSVLDDEGNIVALDSPRNVLVPWGRIEQLPGETVVRAVVALLDGEGTTRWAVTTVQSTEDGPQESEPRFFHV